MKLGNTTRKPDVKKLTEDIQFIKIKRNKRNIILQRNSEVFENNGWLRTTNWQLEKRFLLIVAFSIFSLSRYTYIVTSNIFFFFLKCYFYSRYLSVRRIERYDRKLSTRNRKLFAIHREILEARIHTRGRCNARERSRYPGHVSESVFDTEPARARR